MTPRAQRAAVIGLLAGSLVVAAAAALGSHEDRQSAHRDATAEAPDVWTRLDDVGAALDALMAAADGYLLGGGPTLRAELEQSIQRLAETSDGLAASTPSAPPREDVQLLEALRYLTPRIQAAARELAATPEPRLDDDAFGKAGRLERLRRKASAATAQLRTSVAEASGPRVRQASGALVPAAILMLSLTVACALASAALSALPRNHPLRRAVERGSRWRCLP